MHRIPEDELIVPALELLEEAPNGQMATSDIIAELIERFRPQGEDAQILDGRHDTKFSQKVRNLKSHKTLLKLGYAEEIQGGFRITEAGRKRLESARA